MYFFYFCIQKGRLRCTWAWPAQVKYAMAGHQLGFCMWWAAPGPDILPQLVNGLIISLFA